MSEKKRPVLSISLLVSNNRRDTIEKCMESLVPLREAIPSELIIVDTGCTDGSVDVARKYADKVVQFTWCNDFAAARNAGLCECTGEWFLYLDDDEWFEDASELMDFFKGDERNYCDALWYIQRNYDNYEGITYTDSNVGRCVKMTPNTKFYGKIHEWIEPFPKRIKKVTSYVHHYGYVFKSEEERQKHLMRNLTLEEEAVRENPDDIRMCCQLIQEYWVAKRYEDAISICEETLKRTKQPITDSFVQYMKYTLPRIYKEQGKLDKALEEMIRLEKSGVLLHQTRLGIYYEKALVFQSQKREEEALQEFKNYLKERYWIPKVGDPMEFAIMDFAQYQSSLFLQNAVLGGIKSALRSKNFAFLEEFLDEVIWSKTEKRTPELVWVLLQCYNESEKKELLTKYLPRIMGVTELENQVYAALHMTYESNPEKQEKFCADLEPLGLRCGNFAYFHLLHTEQRGVTTEQDIADYYEKSDRKYDEEVATLFLAKAKQRMVFFSEQKRIGQIELSANDFVVWAKRYAEAVYGTEEWQNGTLQSALPEIRFAYAIEQVLCERDMAEYGRRIKEALKCCPVFLSVVKALLEEREMLTLAEQLKSMVRLQLAEGKTEEAKTILLELQALVPGDMEIKELFQTVD